MAIALATVIDGGGYLKAGFSGIIVKLTLLPGGAVNVAVTFPFVTDILFRMEGLTQIWLQASKGKWYVSCQ